MENKIVRVIKTDWPMSIVIFDGEEDYTHILTTEMVQMLCEQCQIRS